MTLTTMWAPPALLLLGTIASMSAGAQRNMPLPAELGTMVPVEMHGLPGVDQVISEREQQAAGMDNYVLRNYAAAGAASAVAFSIYVGYYERQGRGHTIHSPKNCLPGAGWEALTSSTTQIPAAHGQVSVTKYILQREQQRAVVLYWYQGRGRIEANEYRVKWNLLKDAALRRRSDEALVRIVVPVATTEDAALDTATKVAATLMPVLDRSLPK